MMSSREILERSHILRNKPWLSNRLNGVSNSCGPVRRKPDWAKLDTCLNLACVHDENAVPRYDGAQSMSYAEQRLVLEFTMYCCLNHGIGLNYCIV